MLLLKLISESLSHTNSHETSKCSCTNVHDRSICERPGPHLLQKVMRAICTTASASSNTHTRMRACTHVHRLTDLCAHTCVPPCRRQARCYDAPSRYQIWFTHNECRRLHYRNCGCTLQEPLPTGEMEWPMPIPSMPMGLAYLAYLAHIAY